MTCLECNKELGYTVHKNSMDTFGVELCDWAVVMPPVAETLKREFPEVEQSTRLRRMGEPNIIVNKTTFKNSKYAWADPNFFEVFTLPIIKGDTSTPLSEPFSVVLTKDEAERYFGSMEAAVGKYFANGRGGTTL